MRALTLTQPWAGLVASGIKLVENRPRHIVKPSDFGKDFAIHASRAIDEAVYTRIREIDPDLYQYASSEEIAVDERGQPAEWYRLSRITGAVIAVAKIIHVLDPVAHGIGWAEPAATAPLADDQRRWWFGPIGYVLSDVRAIAQPVRCRGMLGFWTLTDQVAAAVEAQL